MFGLVDGNSFYCSCERAFDPKLAGKPIVVLSNNDGCVIARTQEAKDLGLKMGDPWHIVSKKPELKSVIWKSSNYALYGDMSRRMFDVLTGHAPRVEPYSIDEMFLDLNGLPGDREALGAAIQADVRRIAKIPTCVGIGPTKTLAKLANKLAKGYRRDLGVLDLTPPATRDEIFPQVPVDEIWGMGRASVAKLAGIGVQTVAEFIAQPPDLIRDMLTVTGQRTHAELRGISCMPFSDAPASRKSIACTRSFGKAITAWPDMREAVATYAARAGEKLRRFNLSAGAMQVFMRTNEHNHDPKYANQATFGIEATADSRALIAVATKAASGLWRDGFRYAKAGIVLLDLYRPEDMPVADMFATRDPVKSARTMAALDALNARFGRDAVRPGGLLAKKAEWSMRRGNVSPCYTTRIEDVMRVKA